MTLLQRLGHVVSTQRKVRERSRREVAERTGVSEQYIGRIERGTGNPSFIVLTRLASALDMSLHDFITRIVNACDRQEEKPP